MSRSKVMSVAEIEQVYPDQWVLMEVTREAKRHESVRGRLIAHGKDRNALGEESLRFRESHPEAETYVFHTLREAPEGVAIIL